MLHPAASLPRPTRFGWTFLGFVLLTLLGCMNYQLSMGYLLSFLLGSVWVVAAIEARRQLQGVTVRLQEPGDLFAGQHATVSLHVVNSSGFPKSNCRVHFGAQLLEVQLPAMGETERQLPLLAPARGWLTLPMLRLEGLDALGLFSVTRSEPASAEALLVYPHPEVAPPQWPVQGNQQASSVQRKAGTEEYKGLRAYQRGDVLGRIAWRRGELPDGSLLVKDMDTSHGTLATFDWRLLPAHLNTEERISRLTAWVLGAERQGTAYHLVLPGFLDATGVGEGHAQKCLGALALYQLSGPAPATHKENP